MKISILLPVYNGGDYIESAIKSVLQNSFKNYELIIVNDGSSDDTLDVINTFSDPRIKLFTKENSGLIETLNYGLNKCENDIIMRMDSDDLIHFDKIEIQLNAFIKSKSILMGTSGYLIDSTDKILGSINLPTQNDQIIKSMMRFNSSIIHPSIMTYKSIIQKVNLYSHLMKHAEDYDLFLRLSKHGELSNLTNKLIYLRKGEHNISHINAKEQIINSQIAKDYFKLNINGPISKELYENLKVKNSKNLFRSLHINTHVEIVQHENISSNSNGIKLIFLKILRKILSFLR